MSPLGKLTFALIGFKLFGADGLFAGLFFGHLLVDKTYVIRKIEGYMSHWDDVIRIKLPFKYYRYYIGLRAFGCCAYRCFTFCKK